MKTEDFTTMKMWKKTRRLLRMIAGLTDKTIVETVDRLAVEEWQQLQEIHGKSISDVQIQVTPTIGA
jgi:hypothetical protein